MCVVTEIAYSAKIDHFSATSPVSLFTEYTCKLYCTVGNYFHQFAYWNFCLKTFEKMQSNIEKKSLGALTQWNIR